MRIYDLGYAIYALNWQTTTIQTLNHKIPMTREEMKARTHRK